MFRELKDINSRPEPFEFYTASDLWTEEQVWTMTQDRLRTLGWSWATIARRHDLDRPEDLKYLIQTEFEPRRLGHIFRFPERLPG